MPQLNGKAHADNIMVYSLLDILYIKHGPITVFTIDEYKLKLGNRVQLGMD